jgi:hypothetical protein
MPSGPLIVRHHRPELDRSARPNAGVLSHHRGADACGVVPDAIEPGLTMERAVRNVGHRVTAGSADERAVVQDADPASADETATVMVATWSRPGPPQMMSPPMTGPAGQSLTALPSET